MKDPYPGRKPFVVQAQNIDILRGVNPDSQSSSTILVMIESFPS
jgi:hypothetical protein